MNIKFNIYIFLSLLLFKFLPLNSMEPKNLNGHKDYIVIENNTNIVLNIQYIYATYKIVNEKEQENYQEYNVTLDPKSIVEIPKKIIAYTLHKISTSGAGCSKLIFDKSKINQLINKNLKITITLKSKNTSYMEFVTSLIWPKTLEYKEQKNEEIRDLLNKINVKNETGFKLSIDKIITKEEIEKLDFIKTKNFKEVKESFILEPNQSIDIILQKNENGLPSVISDIEIRKFNSKNSNPVYLSIIDDIKKFDGSKYLSEIDLIIYNKIHGKIPSELAELKSSENINIFYNKKKLHDNIKNNLSNENKRNF